MSDGVLSLARLTVRFIHLSLHIISLSHETLVWPMHGSCCIIHAFQGLCLQLASLEHLPGTVDCFIDVFYLQCRVDALLAARVACFTNASAEVRVQQVPCTIRLVCSQIREIEDRGEQVGRKVVGMKMIR